MKTYKLIFSDNSLLKNNNLINNKYLVNYIQPELQYRSIIYAINKKTVLCFAPPKSISIEKIFSDNSIVNAEEFINGIMINLYWDTEKDDWEIASKNSIGAYDYPFYSIKSIRNLFLESLPNNFDISKLPLYSINNLPLTYSFVLQHRNNNFINYLGHIDFH